MVLSNVSIITSSLLIESKYKVMAPLFKGLTIIVNVKLSVQRYSFRGGGVSGK